MNEEKVKLKLNIAGETIVFTVPYSRQEETRQTEAEVNMMFDTWRKRFPEKKDRELLAMIAFRYADGYHTLLRNEEELFRTAEQLAGRAERLAGGEEPEEME